MKFVKILKAAYNENYDTIRFEYLTGEADKEDAISALLDMGEATNDEEALEIIQEWENDGLTEEEKEYLEEFDD